MTFIVNGKIIFVGSEANVPKAQGFLDENKVSNSGPAQRRPLLPASSTGTDTSSQGDNDLFKVNLNSPLLGGTVDTMDKLVAELHAKAKPFPQAAPSSVGTMTIAACGTGSSHTG